MYDGGGWPVSTLPAGDFALTPEHDAALNAWALRARDDPAARNALYDALAVKVARFVRVVKRRWPGRAIEYEEIEQEAFLAFARLVAEWSGAGSFGAYFLGFFRWRLNHTAAAWVRGRGEGTTVSLDERAERGGREWHPALMVAWPGDRHAGLELDAALLASDPRLSPQDRRLLWLRLVDDRRLEDCARALGWSRRTAYRRWAAIAAAVA